LVLFFKKELTWRLTPRFKGRSMPDTDPFDWLRPRLSALVKDAEQAGIARDISVAVITDLINGPQFSPAPTDGVVDDENWNQDIGEPAEIADARIDQTIEVVDETLSTHRLFPHGRGVGDRIDQRDGEWHGGSRTR
jgi:hypothetical protein